MTKNLIAVLFVLVVGCSCMFLVTEARSTPSTDVIFEDENEEANDEAEEYRFLTGIGNGASTATAINNLITQQQQALEALRPQGGFSSTSAGANVIYVNAGSTGTAASSTASSSSSVAGILLPQVVQAAVGGGNRRSPSRRRRRRRPTNQRSRNGNRNRNRRRPQVYLVRP